MAKGCPDAHQLEAVWRSLRQRIGKNHAISTAQIALHTGISPDRVRSHIKTLRDEGVRIGYSRSRPTGYFIIHTSEEADECTKTQRHAVVAMIIRECTLRGVSLPAVLSEIQREHAANTPPPPAYPATAKQKKYLSRLLLSSIHSEADADNLFRLIASPQFSKQHAARLIDQIQTSIDQRNENRKNSKGRRQKYLDIHHPNTPREVLKRRDVNLTSRKWDEAIDRN